MRGIRVRGMREGGRKVGRESERKVINRSGRVSK